MTSAVTVYRVTADQIKSTDPILTVRLIPPAVAALDELRRSTQLSHVDLVNRALQVYAFLERERAAGRDVVTLDDAGHGLRVRFA